MGCCLFHTELPKIQHHHQISDFDHEKIFKITTSSCFPSSINDPISIINKITMNPLCYALWVGDTKTFKLLIEEKGACFEAMELLFAKQGLNGIEIILTKGYLEMAKYYLPMVLLSQKASDFLRKPLMNQVVLCKNPELLSYIHNYFICVNPPRAFNFHYVDPISGENPALTACRHLDLEAIKFLNQVCEADFSLITFRGQNALYLAVSTMKKIGFNANIIRYLIYECKVDVIYNHECLLKECDDGECAKIIEDELAKRGFCITRENVMRKIQERELRKVEYDVDGNSDVMITAISSISLIESDDFTINSLRESFELYN